MSTASLRARVSLAYGCLYLVWGTTYLGIAVAIQTLPPFTSGAVRFAIAASIMFGWLWLRDPAQFRGLPWRHALVSGVLLGGIGNGFVVWAQQGLSSGIAALVVSSIPVVVLLLNWAFFERQAPERRALVGTGLALAGVAIVIAMRHGVGSEASPAHVVAILIAVLAWSTGTLLQRRAKHPARLLGVTSVQMLAAALFQGAMAIANREWTSFDPSQVSVASVVAVLYLAVFGSIIALTCYVWLLTQEPAQKVATYALVNPVVAVLLGAIVLGERLTVFTVAGALLVLAGVTLVLFRNLRIPKLASPRITTDVAPVQSRVKPESAT
jgi:drug/metabolite transporter (DMT)-like permease